MEENTQTNEVTVTPEVVAPIIIEAVPEVVQEVVEHIHETGEAPISNIIKMELRRISEKEKRRRRLASKVALGQRTLQRKRAKGK